MHSRNSLEIIFCAVEYQKFFEKLNLFLVLTQSQKVLGTTFAKFLQKSFFFSGPSRDHF